MTVQAWIGYCHLRAHDDERRAWIGNRDEAVLWLMLTATSAEDFQTAMRQGAARTGYDLISVSSVSAVADARDLGPLESLLAGLISQVNRVRPVALGGFAPVQQEPAWQETDWTAVLESPGQLWAVVDGVNWPDISLRLAQADADHACLYSTLNPESRAMAPWLVRVDPDGSFAAQLRTRPQSRHGFILLSGTEDLDQMRTHLRRFTMLRTPHDPDASVYFRFYDPRVMIDAIDAMPDSFRDAFAGNLSAIIVPISVECLLPDTVALTGAQVGVLDPADACQGRLLRWTCRASGAAGHRRGPGAVSAVEYAAMGQRIHRRAVNGLARLLWRDYGDLTSASRCRSIADGAALAAAGFGMGSASQVRLIAQVQLLFGADFDTRYPDAGRVLTDATLLPWEKKNRLADWFAEMTEAHGLARKESA